jgi:tRNA threonylcarbamoyl adenosine modification protein (Sua5/YciO/YrdC/YwlC family)
VAHPVEEAAEAALRGLLVVLPTDTVYGIGTRPDDPDATARVFEAKGRPRDLELPVLAPDLAAARTIAAMDARSETLVRRFWPGPLTVVLPRTVASRGWDLGGDPTTIGVRLPRHPLALAVLERTGPLAVTSANRSGSPTPGTCEAIAELFGDAVAVYLCADGPLEGRPSTVVDLAHGGPTVIRAGAIEERAVRDALGIESTGNPGVGGGRL